MPDYTHPFDRDIMEFRQPPRKTPTQTNSDDVRRTRNGNVTTVIPYAKGKITQNQYDYIVDLFAAKNLFASPKWLDSTNAMDAEEYAEFVSAQLRALQGVTKATASAWIDRLRALPAKPVKEQTLEDTLDRALSSPQRFAGGERLRVEYADVETDRGETVRLGYLTDGTTKVPAGRYALDTSSRPNYTNDITFFKLWVGDRYGWSVKLYKSDDNIELTRGQQVGILREIMKDPAAAASLFGLHSSHCGICGRRLTNDESRARGIGPVCASKWGF